ncbi:MAG: MFS transporter [Rhizobiales bacterium]|nr:MFS transporter [Hyphomicrobiales bacterium]
MGFVPRLALVYAAAFAATGVQLPFVPVWLAARGLDQRTIGALLAAAAVARIVIVPLTTRATDHFGVINAGIVAGAMTAAAGTVVLASVSSVPWMFAAYAAAAVGLSTMLPLTDAYALKGLSARGRAYGPVRLWGSVAFIGGNLAAGLLADMIAPVHLIWPIVVAFCATALASILLEPATPDVSLSRTRPSAIAMLRKTPGLLAVLGAASLVQGSHAVYYVFSSLDWMSGGLSGLSVGVLWSLGVVAEILLFAFSARLPAAIGPAALLAFGAFGGALRWAAMAFDPPGVLLVPLQLLHGLTFGATYLGAVMAIAALAPTGLAATAQGLLSTVNGLVMALATAMSGVLHANYGTRSYAAMAVMCLGGAVFAMALRRIRLGVVRQPQSAGEAG